MQSGSNPPISMRKDRDIFTNENTFICFFINRISIFIQKPHRMREAVRKGTRRDGN